MLNLMQASWAQTDGDIPHFLSFWHLPELSHVGTLSCQRGWETYGDVCRETGGIVWVNHTKDLIQAHRWKAERMRVWIRIETSASFSIWCSSKYFVRKKYFKNSWNDRCQHQFENIDDFTFIAKKPDTCEILSFNPLHCLVFRLMETLSCFCNSIWWDFLTHTFGALPWL